MKLLFYRSNSNFESKSYKKHTDSIMIKNALKNEKSDVNTLLKDYSSEKTTNISVKITSNLIAEME